MKRAAAISRRTTKGRAAAEAGDAQRAAEEHARIMAHPATQAVLPFVEMGRVISTNEQDLIAFCVRMARELKGRAPNTRRAYMFAWQSWQRHCAEHGVAWHPIDPELVRTWLDKVAASGQPPTVRARLAALGALHSLMGNDAPLSQAHAVATWMRAYERETTHQVQQAPGLTKDQVRTVAAYAMARRHRRGWARDHALFVIGVLGGFRRAELAGLDFANVSFGTQGQNASYLDAELVEIYLSRSKVDQAGKGKKRVLYRQEFPPMCPVRALGYWMEYHPLGGPGALFISQSGGHWGNRLSPQAINESVKRLCTAVGIVKVSAHSMRRSFANLALDADVPDVHVMRHGDWKQRASLDRYTEELHTYRHNPTIGLFREDANDEPK